MIANQDGLKPERSCSPFWRFIADQLMRLQIKSYRLNKSMLALSMVLAFAAAAIFGFGCIGRSQCLQNLKAEVFVETF